MSFSHVLKLLTKKEVLSLTKINFFLVDLPSKTALFFIACMIRFRIRLSLTSISCSTGKPHRAAFSPVSLRSCSTPPYSLPVS